MSKRKIAILGGGNLGTAMARGIMAGDLAESYRVTVTRRQPNLIRNLEESGVKVMDDNLAAIADADIIILAVQPKQLDLLLQLIAPAIDPAQHIMISVITGIKIKDIAAKVGEEVKIIRAMPNTAIAIQKSMTCLATNNASMNEMVEVENLFNALGKTLVIQENLMEAATVLGACGIAFFLRYIRAASQGGIEVGFHANEAQLIASQTALGAASLLLETNQHPEEAIDKVTTPQGCTIAGLNEMEHFGLSSALIKGIITSYKKIDKIT